MGRREGKRDLEEERRGSGRANGECGGAEEVWRRQEWGLGVWEGGLGGQEGGLGGAGRSSQPSRCRFIPSPPPLTGNPFHRGAPGAARQPEVPPRGVRRGARPGLTRTGRDLPAEGSRRRSSGRSELPAPPLMPCGEKNAASATAGPRGAAPGGPGAGGDSDTPLGDSRRGLRPLLRPRPALPGLPEAAPGPPHAARRRSRPARREL